MEILQVSLDDIRQAAARIRPFARVTPLLMLDDGGRLLSDPGLRASLGREARARVEVRFSEDVVFGRLGDILTSLAFPGGGAR